VRVPEGAQNKGQASVWPFCFSRWFFFTFRTALGEDKEPWSPGNYGVRIRSSGVDRTLQDMNVK
ncbi:MAG: hypothetical protein RR679_14160, partial [Glutamicibacter sp.]|uniref:hypothetical protein n=1 Tax=Glutamicibacter sp. TaxID=1931995 RepID=UPI002FCBC690